MKDFLKEIIQRMWSIAGYDQAKELQERGGLTAVTQLIDDLVIECTKFPKIPDLKKQDLIEQGIRTEVANGYFRGLNAALINKWFYAYGISKQVTGLQPDDPPGFAERQEQNKQASLERIAKKKKADPNWCIENDIKDFQERIKLMKSQSHPQPARKRYYDNGTEDVEYTETK